MGSHLDTAETPFRAVFPRFYNFLNLTQKDIFAVGRIRLGALYSFMALLAIIGFAAAVVLTAYQSVWEL